jgi:ribosome-binding factor A
MANRQERIPTLIQKNISSILTFELKNSKIGFVTVNEVEVSPDFSHAKVYVSFLGAKYPRQNLEELNKSRGFVRSSLASKMDTRKVPDINFILDDSYEKAEKLERILTDEEKELQKILKK